VGIRAYRPGRVILAGGAVGAGGGDLRRHRGRPLRLDVAAI